MDYAGTIAVDLTGGDTIKRKWLGRLKQKLLVAPILRKRLLSSPEKKTNETIEQELQEIESSIPTKPILERTMQKTLEAARDFPDIQFYVAGPAEKVSPFYFPGNVRIISPNPGQNSLERIIVAADQLKLDGIVTHEKAKTLQQGILGSRMEETSLKTVCGLRRPALAAILPTKFKRKYVIALDVGANHWNKPVELEQYAHVGAILSKYLFQKKEPNVSVFNMCEESDFGPSEYQELYPKLVSAKEFHFKGFTESRHILGLVQHMYDMEENQMPDVAVFEGFCGNEFIKVLQDGIKLGVDVTLQEMLYSPIPVVGHVFTYTRAGLTFLLNLDVLHRIEKRLNSKRFGGALLTGIRTAGGRDLVFIKGHGEADKGIYHGIKRAIEYHKQGIILDVNREIEETLMATDTVKSSDRERFEEKQKEKLYAEKINAPNQI